VARRIVERRTTPFPAIGGERELRDDEHRSGHVLHGSIHVLRLVFEDAQLANFSGHVFHVGGTVSPARRRPAPAALLRSRPTSLPPTVTDADDTRWTTALIVWPG